MSTIVQICVVVGTIAVVVMAFIAVRLMFQLQTTTKKFARGYARVEQILEESRDTSRKVGELVDVLEQIAVTVRTTAGKVEGVVDRAASVSSTVIDEVEQPIRGVVAWIHGLRSGVRTMARRWNGRRPVLETRQGEGHE